MMPKRLRLERLEQCPAWKWHCHRLMPTVATSRHLTTRAPKNPSSSSSSSSSTCTSSSDSSSPSLYQKLFSKKPATDSVRTRPSRRLAAIRQDPPEPSHARRLLRPGRDGDGEQQRVVLPLGDELRAWFEHAVQEATKSKDPEAGATVLVLNNASRSLLESDFYRLAPQGRHVEGWAGGITKVVQSISTLTREPQGQYYLFFDTRAAAELYVKELLRLWNLGRKQLRSSPWPDSFYLPHERKPDADHGARNALSKKDVADLRLYTILPPTAIPLAYTLHTPSELSALIGPSNKPEPKSKSANKPSRHHQEQRTLPPLSPTAHAPSNLLTHLSLHLPPPTAAFPPLPLAEDDHPPPAPAADAIDMDHRVLVRFRHSKVPLATMHALLEADGARRNLPWRLAAAAEHHHHRQHDGDRDGTAPPAAAAAVEPVRAGSGPVDWSDAAKEEAARRGEELAPTTGYERFVVSFAEAAEARRFARAWHRREMVDERTERGMVVEATALW